MPKAAENSSEVSWHEVRSQPMSVVSSQLKDRAQLVLRSAMVGAIATIVDLTILTTLVTGLGVHARLASIPALTLGIVAQFLGNKIFAFRDSSYRWVKQGAQFLGVEFIGFVFNILIFDLIVSHTDFPYLPARILVTSVVYFLICLPLWSKIFQTSSE